MHHQGSRAIVPPPVASPPAQPARGGGQATRGGGQAIRGGDQQARGQSGVAQPYFYAFPARPEAESSDIGITSMIPVFHRDALVLFDPGSTYSYVSSSFASYLFMPHDYLSAPMYMYTTVEDYIVVDPVYRLCVITIGSLETSVDLLLLNMVDFDIILGMDCLSPYHPILDFHPKTVTLVMPGLPRLE
ncbi:uncharacterized protein [Nicotiana tomentosiformis]|uniref:uncharacterized protein n=1 Tax=Nicotiana tomentosiformis TaxID=4098 RepID=UPI00388CC4C7